MLEQFSQHALSTMGYGQASGAMQQMRDSALNPMGSFSMMANDAAIAGGMAFLQSELEKLDPKVREPLTRVTWMRDVPVKSGERWLG